MGYEHFTVGIDKRAVDYVLLDKKGNRSQEVVPYRDRRTELCCRSERCERVSAVY